MGKLKTLLSAITVRKEEKSFIDNELADMGPGKKPGKKKGAKK